MGFIEAVKTCMTRKYASFEGRASRSEYWFYMLFYILLGAAVMAIIFATGGLDRFFIGRSPNWGVFAPIFILMAVMFLPTISVAVRRLHDRDMSGWWYLGLTLLSAIPYVGILASIYWLVINCMRGTNGPNRFGRDPLGTTHSADVFA